MNNDPEIVLPRIRHNRDGNVAVLGHMAVHEFRSRKEAQGDHQR